MPHCEEYDINCPFEGAACREYVCPVMGEARMGVTASSRINCPVLRQYGHCGRSEACKGCTKLK